MQKKTLQLRSKALKQAGTCSEEISALLKCWSSMGIDNAGCKSLADQVKLCALKPVSKQTKQSFNDVLARLEIPAVSCRRRVR